MRTFSPNTKPVTAQVYYGQYYAAENVESNTYDASFLKIREVRLEYAFTKHQLRKTPFSSLSIGLVWKENLFCFTDFPVFDPEIAALNGGNIVPGIEAGSLPSTRSNGYQSECEFLIDKNHLHEKEYQKIYCWAAFHGEACSRLVRRSMS